MLHGEVARWGRIPCLLASLARLSASCFALSITLKPFVTVGSASTPPTRSGAKLLPVRGGPQDDFGSSQQHPFPARPLAPRYSHRRRVCRVREGKPLGAFLGTRGGFRTDPGPPPNSLPSAI